MALLLERYCFLLEEKGVVGDAMCESRGGKEDRRLKDSFNRLYRKGTDYVKSERFQNVLTSCQLKVKPKTSNVSGLQLADIVAHPSRREMLLEAGVQQSNNRVLGDSIIDVIQDKYYSRYGKTHGYGKKMIP